MARGDTQEDRSLVEDHAVTFGYRYGVEPPLPRTFVPTGEVGTRAPQVWLEGEGGPRSIPDLFGKGFVLLAGTEAWSTAGRMLTDRTRLPLRIHAVNGWQRAHGVEDEGACLVWPDGMVAARWVGGSQDAERALAEALQTSLFRGAFLQTTSASGATAPNAG